MTVPTNTLLTTGGSPVVGMREDISPVVSRMNPGDTPLLSWMSPGSAKNDLNHDWETIDIRAPAKNARAEGDVYVASPARRPTRLSNCCQIVDDTREVSNTAQAVDVVGDTNTLEFQMLLAADELKRDLEYSVASGQVVKRTDPREMAGLQSFSGNASMGATATLPTGDGLTAPVAGTTRYISIDILNSLMQAGWAKGARYSIAFHSMTQKLLFDSLVPAEQQLAQPQVAVAARGNGVPLITTVSVWQSAMGPVEFMPDPVFDEASLGLNGLMFLFDGRPEYRPKLCPLPGQDWYRDPLAKVARADWEAIGWEGTIEVPNPMAVAFIGDLKTS
jgi:hypothetical protein